MNRWTDAVWNEGPEDPIERYVLLRIADRADRSGFCFPSLASIASDTRLSESTIKRALRRLATEGWITFTPGSGRGKRSHYQLLKKGSERTPSESDKGIHTEPLSATKRSPERTPSNDMADDERGSHGSQKGVTVNGKGVTEENPPYNPPVGEPSKNPQRTPTFLQAQPAMEKNDPRHSLFKKEHETWFEELNGIAPQWGGREGKALKEFLAAHPTLTLQQWKRILRNRAASPCNTGKPLYTWIQVAPCWLNGLADDFGNAPRRGWVDRNRAIEDSIRARHAARADSGDEEPGLLDVILAQNQCDRAALPSDALPSAQVGSNGHQPLIAAPAASASPGTDSRGPRH